MLFGQNKLLEMINSDKQQKLSLDQRSRGAYVAISALMLRPVLVFEARRRRRSRGDAARGGCVQEMEVVKSYSACRGFLIQLRLTVCFADLIRRGEAGNSEIQIQPDLRGTGGQTE